MSSKRNVHKRKRPDDINSLLCPSPKQIVSKLFTDKTDQSKFQKIFEAIDDSQLIKLLNVTHAICQIIAEFGNGQLKVCAAENCQELTSVLHGDKNKNPNHLPYKYCKVLNNYFCVNCSPNVVINHCAQNTAYCDGNLVHTPTGSKCEVCPAYYMKRCCDDGYKCCVCKKAWCYDCREYYSAQCVICDESMCEPCAGYLSCDDAEMLGICKLCWEKYGYDKQCLKIVKCQTCKANYPIPDDKLFNEIVICQVHGKRGRCPLLFTIVKCQLSTDMCQKSI